MSSPLFKSDTMYIQRMLKSCGLYTGRLDGSFGPLTSQAEDAFEKAYDAAAKKYGSFDLRTEGTIATLLPAAQIKARQFMNVKPPPGLVVKLLSGTRTYAEQNALFAQGRSRPGRVVTNARGGSSNHNFGIAWDVGIFEGGLYYTGRNSKENKAYAALAQLVKAAKLGLEWGGDWKTIVDMPHYQLPTGKSVSQVRALFEAGKAYV
jgi:peptidoglycan L-alanyl-D-glutamate endopeptidase CwlK